MKLRLLHKIFLANVSVILMLSVILLSFSYYGFKSVTSYIDEARGEVTNILMQDLSNELAAYYMRESGWQSFSANGHNWKQFMKKWHRKPSARNHHRNMIDRAEPGPPLFDPKLGKPPTNPRLLLDSVSLLAADGSVIVPAIVQTNQPEQIAIRVGGNLIGWLQYSPHNQDHLSLGILKRQLTEISLLAFFGVMLSAAVSFYLARHFTKPLKYLTEGAIRLSNRQFDTEINHDSNDELAELAHFFNEIGRRLASYEQQQKQWLQDIAHELRTPLTLIRGEIEAMVDGVSQINSDTLLQLKSDVLQLNHLINDLHELSVTDDLSLLNNTDNFDISLLCSQISSRYQPKLLQRGIQLSAQCTPAWVYGDDTRMYQVLTNLFENELRYCQEHGHVWLSCKVISPWVEVVIEDSGPGLDGENLNRMFDRLYRADSHRNRRFGGSGLGLAICKNIIVAHGGNIEASHSNNGGVKVTIRLPAVEGEHYE